MFKITKKGSLMVEATIILPVVIIAVLTISSLIKINAINENVMHRALEESRVLAIESYTAIGQISVLKYREELENKIKNENPNISEIEVSDFKYLHSGGGIDKLISFSVSYKIDLKLPIQFYKYIAAEDVVVCRAFVGTDKYKVDNGFSEMEQQDESDPVWVFPVSGAKYHKEECSYIKVAAVQTTLNSSLKRKYKECSICLPLQLPNGSQVYCFFGSGKVYHKSSCYTVDRYVEEVEKSHAVKRGYTPCLKCGG